MELRPHQIKAVEMLRESLRTGHKRPILAAPCSFGKTITAAYLLKSAADKGKRAVFICDRIKLVEQALESFDNHNLNFGVIQGDHWRSNLSAPIQIASTQTLAKRIKKFGMKAFDFDFAIVDECHTHYKHLTEIMAALNAIPFIGLSATPFSKGLGKHYDDLIVPITPRDLLAAGYLCPVDYYGGRRIALEGIKSRAIPTGGTDYDPNDLSDAIEKDTQLTGDIIQNWLKHAKGRQTVAFSPSIKHSKYLVEQFNAAGIPAEHIDGYMDLQEREDIMKAHDNGEFLILSCSRLLNTGWDSPSTSCLIDCFPTKSYIVYVQRIGRIMRTAEGKENAIVLDHAGNAKLGFAEDVVPESLDDGEGVFNEKKQTSKKDKKESKLKDCPQCYREFIGIRCSCGYEIPVTQQIETTQEELVKLAKVDNRMYSNQQKSEWLAGLMLHAKNKGYSEGWASHKYKEKFGVWPNKTDRIQVDAIPDDVRSWITSQNIRYAKRKDK